jgi:MFS family permease
MVVRFCLYSIFKNLRFFEAFFLFYLLSGPEWGGVGLSYFEVGALVGYQKLLTGILEIPSGIATDQWGRRRALVLCFSSYVVAFPIYAASAGVAGALQIGLLYAAQTMFGVGEALRTGSHKAIMLDWADRAGPRGGATWLIGFTRFFSKTSAGLSALAGGALVYFTGAFVWLFWASTIPALLGAGLMLSYPRWLEGEIPRTRGAAGQPGWAQRLKSLWAAPGIVALMLHSIIFESQIKLAQHYTQPFLKEGFGVREIVVVGGIGALAVGAYYFIQHLVDGTASIMSAPLERRLGGGLRANKVVTLLAMLVSGLLALCLFKGWLFMGMIGFIALTGLQNARRPLFIALLNEKMDKPQRATTLSVDSQLRSWSVALLAPATGYLADCCGLPWAFLAISILFAAALLIRCE